jgi:SNF2 family DNA or RNA helicase
LWWNPAVENQATDRAYRIGQKKNVMVHRMICKNTFEERIDEMIQKKKHLADMTVASGENWIGKLSNKELREIFG